MKKSVLFLISILLLMVLTSCDKDSTKPEDVEVQISEHAKAITSQQAEQIIALEDDQIWLSTPQGTTGYQVGDILASGPIELAPDGFLRKVTGVVSEDTETILHTEQARLVDVFEQANISLNENLRSSNIRDTEYLADGVTFVSNSKDPLAFNYTIDYVNSSSIPGTTLTVSGDLQLLMGYELDIRTRRNQGITYLKGGASISETSALQLDVDTNIFSIEESIDLVSHQFQPILFFVGGFPIVIAPKVIVVLNIDGQGSTNVSTRVETEASAIAGLIYQNSAWETYSSENISLSHTPPVLQGSLQANIAAGPRLEMNLYGVAGPFVCGYGVLDLNADMQSDPWWVLNGGFRADVGVHMDAIGYEQDYVAEAVINHMQTLAQASGAITGFLTGYVFNASNNQALTDVTVSLYSVANPTVLSYSGNTLADGSFSVEANAGVYNVVFSKPGFISATQYNVIVNGLTTNPIQSVLQIDESYQGQGTISGYIRNALTNHGVANVNLLLRAGINNSTGSVVANTQTGSDGAYSFTDIDAGNYTISCSATDFLDNSFSVICLGGQNTGNQNAIITPEMNEDEIRIVLTWGESPRDLDSHLTGPIPDSSNRFHVYYSSKYYNYNGETYAMLDIDDTSSYGPETTTIFVQSPGLYRFSVHDYTNGYSTNSYALSNSSAQVTVWRGNTHAQTFHVPINQVGVVWTVFEMAGSQILPVNTLSNNTDYKQSDVNWNTLPTK